MNMNKLVAEAVGTFALVASVLGAALFSFPNAGILGVALSIGCTVMAMAYAIGHISGGHFNPAVTLGLWAGGRFNSADIIPYIVAQCVGGILAAAVFYLIASGKAGFDPKTFASNTYGALGSYPATTVFIIEAVLTALFLIIIMGVTSRKAPAGFAPIAIGLTLAALHIMAIPVSNASINPARTLATALFASTPGVLSQVPLFVIATIVGGLVGGFVGRWLQEE
jgi:aquaporin Z